MTARLAFGFGPLDLIWRLAVVTTGIGLHYGRIDGKALAVDQSSRHACDNDTLEDVSKDITRSEPVEPVLRKGRVVRYPIIKVEPTEPAMRQMQFDLLLQPALRAQAVAVPNNQHPDH